MTDIDLKARVAVLEAALGRARKTLEAALVASADYGAATIFARGRGSLAAEVLIDLRSTAPAEGRVEKVLGFGKGALVLEGGTYGEDHAVFIFLAKEPGLVNTSAAREVRPADRLVEGEIVLTFPTKGQADYVMDALYNRERGSSFGAAAPQPPTVAREDGVEDDLVSRAEVLRVLRALGDQDADLAIYGATDNARAREYGEAAATRACCAVAIMPSALTARTDVASQGEA